MHTQSRENRLEELIKRRGFRDAVVAVHCDVDQSTVWRWKTGRTPIPDDQKLRLAGFFGVSRAYLMGWDDEPDSEPQAAA